MSNKLYIVNPKVTGDINYLLPFNGAKKMSKLKFKMTKEFQLKKFDEIAPGQMFKTAGIVGMKMKKHYMINSTILNCVIFSAGAPYPDHISEDKLVYLLKILEVRDGEIILIEE